MISSKILQLEYRKVYEMAQGLSTGVCLPKNYTKDLDIKSGDFVKISQEGRRIIIEKAKE